MTNQNHLESPEKLRKAQEENKIQKITIERLSDLDIIQEIGRGATGVVFKVRHKKNQKEYALKKIEVKHLNQKEQNEVLKEVS